MSELTDAARAALDADRVIDITTTGAKSGEPRRIEIWFHNVDGRIFITGLPPKPRGWYANLVANPDFTFHLKESASADLAATARPITAPDERRSVFEGLIARTPGLTTAPNPPIEKWLEHSPLVEVTFA
ncbi:MAG: nitroreductase/quinone reductase family protein [Microbacteriaceae bacterium]|nr:nitroreductase/quinone reductase family protein [Microbacteriaceae bacterium]MCL2793948.1 nitroreductase/quinone reductase family protein [Microbacteriaceae bacterium]